MVGVSRRARLVDIEYVDTNEGSREMHPAFFLEDSKAMRKRTGTKKPLSDTPASYKTVKATSAADVLLSEALVANTDWQLGEVVSTHWNVQPLQNWNIKLVQNGSGEALAVPYDFDISRTVSGIDVPDDAGVFHAKFFRDRTKNFRQVARCLYNFNALFAPEIQTGVLARFLETKPAIDFAIQSMGVDEEGRKLAVEQSKDFYDAIAATRGNYMFGPTGAAVFSDQAMTRRVCAKFFPNAPIIVLSNQVSSSGVRFQLIEDLPNDPNSDGTLPCEAIGASEVVKKTKIFWTSRSSLLGTKNPL